MLTYLFEKMKTDTEYIEVKQLEEEIERRRKAEEDKEAKEDAKRQAAIEAAQQEKIETLGRKYVNNNRGLKIRNSRLFLIPKSFLLRLKSRSNYVLLCVGGFFGDEKLLCHQEDIKRIILSYSDDL